MKAFPSKNAPYYINNEGASLHQAGMDLRDYFAAKAMQPLIQDYLKDMDWENDNPYTHFAMATQVAYKIADQMIEARKQ